MSSKGIRSFNRRMRRFKFTEVSRRGIQRADTESPIRGSLRVEAREGAVSLNRGEEERGHDKVRYPGRQTGDRFRSDCFSNLVTPPRRMRDPASRALKAVHPRNHPTHGRGRVAPAARTAAPNEYVSSRKRLTRKPTGAHERTRPTERCRRPKRVQRRPPTPSKLLLLLPSPSPSNRKLTFQSIKPEVYKR